MFKNEVRMSNGSGVKGVVPETHFSNAEAKKVKWRSTENNSVGVKILRKFIHRGGVQIRPGAWKNTKNNKRPPPPVYLEL